MRRLRILKANSQHLKTSCSLSWLWNPRSHPKAHLDISLPHSMGKGQHFSVFQKVKFWENDIYQY